jgi:hypothetical protein
MSRNIFINKYDTLDQPQEAASEYERHISAGDADVESYLNLLVLYICCQDGGYICHHGLDQEFLTLTWKRINDVISEMHNKFTHNEIDFWEYYKNHLANPAHNAEVLLDICKRGPSLAPYFLYYSLTRDRSVKGLLNKLLEEVNEGTTARERYIKSHVMSSILHDDM